MIYIEFILAAIGAFSTLAQVTPNSKNKKLIDLLWWVIDRLAMNNLNAKSGN